MWKYMRRHLALFVAAGLLCPLSVALQMKLQLVKGEVLDQALSGKLFSWQGPLPALAIYLFTTVSLAFLYSALRTYFGQKCSRTLRQSFFKSFLSRSPRQQHELAEGEVFSLYS